MLRHIALAGIASLSACIVCPPASSQTASPDSTESEAVWDGNLHRAVLLSKSEEVKMLVAHIEADFGPNHKASSRYRLGNLALFYVVKLPPPDAMDANSSSQYVGVILGTKFRFIRLPNRELFAQFARNIRANPEQYELNDRIGITLMLATGSDVFTIPENGQKPTWTDEDGTLTIRYHKDMPRGMMKPITVACTLTVDANQAYTHTCDNPDYRPGPPPTGHNAQPVEMRRWNK